MAISVIFKLKEPQSGISPNKQKATPVNMYFNYGYYSINKDGSKKYLPLKYATGEKIKPCYWKDRPVYRARQTKEFDYDNFNTRLENIERAARKIYRDERNANRLPGPDQLRDLLDKELNSIPDPAHARKETLNEFIDRFNSEIKSGQRLISGKSKRNYGPGTVKNYKSFKNQFSEYQKDRMKKIDFDDIGKDFYNDFVSYFSDKGQSPNNIGKHIKSLKTIMRAALEEVPPLHTNTEFNKKYFAKPSSETQEIYLNKDEIEKIAKHDLSFDKEMDLARDMFLIGVYTAQRYSDYSRIRNENIRVLQSGTRVIDLIQKKTGGRVIIPIMPELDKIFKKYNYNLPKTYDQKINSHIKTVARLAGLTEMIPVEKIQGGLVVKKDHPKCKLISTHTGRRSGATNMYLAGIPTIDIMKLTGHKTESEFLKYIKVGQEETADKLARHSYFSKHLKIAK